jgi:mono/diheme cytochrome c family protein
MRELTAAIAAFTLAACQSAPASEGAALASPASPGEQEAPRRAIGDIAFIEAACADCHAIRRLELSPNPEAPSFADIGNREGLTGETLSAFLKDAHNYPEAMDFDLTPARADALSAYILTLREENYRPAQ